MLITINLVYIYKNQFTKLKKKLEAYRIIIQKMVTSFNRKTEFWKDPGSCNLVQQHEFKPSSAPFYTGVKRKESLRNHKLSWLYRKRSFENIHF